MKCEIVNYEINSNKINDLNITLIGDIHNFYDKPHFDKTIKEINDLNSDILLVAGDITNTGKSWTNREQLLKIRKMLEEFAENQKVAIIPGNHDLIKLSNKGLYNFQNLETIKRVYPLFNSSIDLKIKNKDVNITGYVPSNESYITKVNNLKHKILNDLDKTIDNELKTFKSFETPKNDSFNILLNHDPRIMENSKIKNEANKYDLITGAHMHNGYMPLSYTTNYSNMYDCDYFYLLNKNNTSKKGYTRGVIYGDTKEFVFIDQLGNYFYKKGDLYSQINKDQAEEFINKNNISPIVITSGINKYVGLPIDCEEITRIRIK